MSKSIYHITHIKNLESILNTGGLIANNTLKQQQISYLDIAHRTIQDRRAQKLVPCGKGGCLHDYVPFYFAPRSPMLYTINKGNVEGYEEGQNPVIHLVSNAELVAANNLDFVFTDGHAVMAYAEFYKDLQQLSVIDWKLMQSKYWSNTNDDPNRKYRRQAEFLVHQFCPWKLITQIGVANNTVQVEVQQILQKFNSQIPIQVYPSWYY